MMKSASLTSEAYGRLRSDIISGSIKPGEKLKIRAICERYRIGAGPVREALNRLASEGLLDHRDQRGFRVHAVTLEDLDELILARCWANEVGLRNSVRSGGLAWEEGVAATCQQLEDIPRYISDDSSERSPAWEQAHGAFHAALVAASGSSWINDFCTQLYIAAERYRHAARSAMRADRNEQKEHQAIAQAAIARRENEAVDLLMEHFRLTARLVRSALRQSGM